MRPSTLAGPVWVCRPGQAADPCAADLAATAVTAGGTLQSATWPQSALASKFDCFYVHPTDSLAGTANTGLAVTKLDIYVADEQAAPLSQVCDVWAPSYRSQTWPSVQKGLAGDEAIMRSTFTVAYDSVLPAWQWFLAHSDGKPIILVGDSQGSAVLIHLISAQLDHEPSVLRRLVVVILVGGNLQVPARKTVGATFTDGPVVHRRYPDGVRDRLLVLPVAAAARLGVRQAGPGHEPAVRPDGQAGQQVACVNPAALTGGPADLDPYLLTATQTTRFPIDSGRLTEPVSTPWVTYPGLYSASCEHGGGATWLQVTSLAGISRTRPVVNDDQEGNLGGTGPAWGYHGYEYWLALGNLLQDIAGQEAAWQSRH